MRNRVCHCGPKAQISSASGTTTGPFVSWTISGVQTIGFGLARAPHSCPTGFDTGINEPDAARGSLVDDATDGYCLKTRIYAPIFRAKLRATGREEDPPLTFGQAAACHRHPLHCEPPS